MGTNVLDRFRLDGKVALVTGGSRGLGYVIAEALSSAGAAVALSSRTAEPAKRAAESIAKATGRDVVGLAADVTAAANVESMIERVLQSFGRIDILVNNAGINVRGPIEDLREDDWDAVIDTNLKGPWLCCRAVAPAMKRQKWGRVINVSSMLGEIALPGRTPYASSKGGHTMLTKTLALEWAPFNVNVNAIGPALVITEGTIHIKNNPELAEKYRKTIPLGRLAEPSDMAGAVCFLASEAADFITGQTIYVDGGVTAG